MTGGELRFGKEGEGGFVFVGVCLGWGGCLILTAVRGIY